MDKPKLTVVVTTYNHEKTIAKALDSILEQKTEYSYQIWILEDCSTDGTLEICRKYAENNPDKVILIAQRVNTKLKHFNDALRKVNTEYISMLEGDDYWCDKEKIQKALDVLEKNLEYVTFAHDTLYENLVDGTNQSLVHEILKIEIKNPVNFAESPYLHTSSRIHRNVVNFKKFPKKLAMFDVYIFYLFLDKGPLYFYDKVMSVYNISGKGTWSKLNKKEQAENNEMAYFNINRLLDYRHDSFFSSRMMKSEMLTKLKKHLGLRLGSKIYALIMYKKFAGTYINK